MDYTIEITNEAGNLYMRFSLQGRPFKAFAIIPQAGQAYVPLEAVLLIQTLKDEGFELAGITYPHEMN